MVKLIESIVIDLNQHKNQLIKRNFYIMERWLEGDSLVSLAEKFNITKVRARQLKDKSMHFLFYYLKRNHPEAYYQAFLDGSYNYFDTNSNHAKYLLNIVKSINWINEEPPEEKDLQKDIDKFIDQINEQHYKLMEEIAHRQKIIKNMINKFFDKNMLKDD
jgi:hypothetical protein